MAAGLEERLSAIADVLEYTDGAWRMLATTFRGNTPSVVLDGLLDALVLALTACATESEFKRLPPHEPTDVHGVPMQMVYRSETALR